MVITKNLGDTRLALLTDAALQLNGDSVFSPASRTEWGAGVDADPEGSIDVVVRCLLVSCNGRHTLVDTGFGDSDPVGSLPQSLAEVGVGPNDIQRVIITHAHGDHCQGNTVREGPRRVPAYSNAEYVMQNREAEWVRGTSPEAWEAHFQPIESRGRIGAPRLRLIDGETELDDGLSCRPTPGHTIGHQSVIVRNAGLCALYMGDLAILAAHMEHPGWGPDWAWSREADQESRRAVARWAVENDAILILGHDPRMPWVRLQETEAGYRAVPV